MKKGMEEKFWKKYKMPFSLGHIDRVIEIEFCALGGPESRGLKLQKCQKHVFPAKNLVPKER